MRFSSPRPLVENSWESWVFKGAGGSYGTPYSFETGTICTDKCTGKHDAASGILGVNDGTGEQHPGVTLVGAVACGGSNSPCHGGHYGQGFAVRASLSVFVALRLSPHVPLPDRPTNRALLSPCLPLSSTADEQHRERCGMPRTFKTRPATRSPSTSTPVTPGSTRCRSSTRWPRMTRPGRSR